MPDLLSQFKNGRTDLVFELVANGHAPVSLVQDCAYFGDVTAFRFLLTKGAPVARESLGLAAYHGHWRLCEFLIELGADVNQADPETGETPLHNAVSKTDRLVYDRVLKVLLANGANPKVATKPGIVTGAFMRDCRTKGETPLHRAAAFGEPETIRMLKDAGAMIDARDVNGETPLSWGSWYGRDVSVLRELLYGDFYISSQNRSMRANLLGDPADGNKTV